MMLRSLYLLPFFCFIATPLLVAGESHLVSAQEARLESLSLDGHWQALIHYESEGDAKPSWESQVDDKKFFLAADGKHQPLAELRATLRAFYAPADDPDTHAICRFPARWQWLSEELRLPPPPLTPLDCPEFKSWLDIIKPHSVTLVFASSYLNSPSSMFGHTFLRIDPEHVKRGSNWLSYAVNFGAELNAEDNSILYAYKGLFGGYPGFFSVMPYHDKINEYSRLENRDLWEYQLNLTPLEARHMAWHLWELRNIDFDYYFFDENCSYRLLELLEVARSGTDLTDSFKMRAIPVDTVRAVARAGLISKLLYRPSEATDLQFQAEQLAPEQRRMAHRLPSADAADFRALPPPAQTQILRVAYKYSRYMQLNRERDPDMAEDSLRVLKQLRDQPPSPVAVPPRPTAPEKGHDTRLLGLAAGQSNGVGLLDLRLRASYHDLLDNSDGYPDGAAINIGELQLRQRKGKALQLEMFNFVDINSHSPQTSFFSPVTWRVRAGFERLYSAKDSTLVARVNGGAGITRFLTERRRHLIYGMATARLEYNNLLHTNLTIGAGALAGSLLYLPFGTLQLEGDYSRFSDGGERSDLKLTQNLQLGKNDALRFNLLRRKQLDTRFNEIRFEYRHYY